jgi:hypothetical protein
MSTAPHFFIGVMINKLEGHTAYDYTMTCGRPIENSMDEFKSSSITEYACYESEKGLERQNDMYNDNSIQISVIYIQT